MRMLFAVTSIVMLIATSGANAADYYRSKWFDYPDPFTAPQTRVDSGCAKWAKPWVGAKICVNPTHVTVNVALLRKDVVFIVSGPDSPDQAVQRAVTGYATGCAVSAIAAAEGAAAATPSPEPGARIGAAAAVLYSSFATCISAVSVAGVVGGIVGQLHINIDTSGSHWAPV